MYLDTNDFAGLVERVEDRIGRTAAWALAIAIGVMLPILAVAGGLWWYLG